MNGFFEFIESINLLILFCGTGKKKKKITKVTNLIFTIELRMSMHLLVNLKNTGIFGNNLSLIPQFDEKKLRVNRTIVMSIDFQRCTNLIKIVWVSIIEFVTQIGEQGDTCVSRLIQYWNKAYQEYGFPGHPAYRQWHRAIDFVIIARVQFVVRTEIRDFNVISFAHQAIPVIENHRYRPPIRRIDLRVSLLPIHLINFLCNPLN